MTLALADDVDLKSLNLEELKRMYNRGCSSQQQLEKWLDLVLEEIIRRSG